MASVWAHCIGLEGGENRSLRMFEPFTAGNVRGWNYCTNFERLPDLIDYLTDHELSGRLELLAINSHGSPLGGGDVRLDSLMSSATFDRFNADFRRLRSFYPDPGKRPKLVFTGCNAGFADRGTQLMRLVSSEMPDITIVAFEQSTEQRTFGSTGLTAGLIHIGNQAYMAKSNLSSPFHPATKWVLNGVVLRYGMHEQEMRVGMRCAYPLCPGHSNPRHQCDGSWNKGCEWFGLPATRFAGEYSHYADSTDPGLSTGGEQLGPYYPSGRHDPTRPATGRGRFRRPGALGTRRPRP